ALNDAGEAIATWTLENGSKEDVQSSTRSGPTASWTAPLTQAEGEPYFEPSTQQRAAIDAHGAAIAMWSVPSAGGNEKVSVAVKPGAGEAWQAPVTLSGGSSSNSSQSPRVAFDAAGEALAVWSHSNGSYTAIQTSRLSTPTGSWSTAQNISESANYGFEPDVAGDPGGDAMAVWALSSGSHSYIQAASYVAAGPLLSGVSIPASGEVEEQLSFSVDPLDAWTSLGATKWSFGDGQHEEGTSVTHAYAAPGSYEVEVQSTDALGNVSTEKGTVVVEGPPEAQPSAQEPPAGESPKHEFPQQEPPAQPVASVTPTSTPASSPAPSPILELLTKAPQPLINTRALTIKVTCGDAPCSAAATAWVELPGQHKTRTWRLAGPSGTVAEDTTGQVRLMVPHRLRHAVRLYLRHHPRYQVQLHLTVVLDADGQPSQSVSATLPIWTYPGFL
ncbi:MAG TPA: PKD domain-containing protein, partial [Solirubrobacteraceae bacterium]|nr:PKD domain-containing protein [Solirubrobacteraceae bacterium]